MLQVELLTGAASSETRKLWEEVFWEDSSAFVDYYYKNKANRNIWLVIRESGEIQSMLALTPYELCIPLPHNCTRQGDQTIYPTYYIVGVATRERFRHRGYMTCLLENAFAYMLGQNVLFTFLMPADPAIYEPFGFRYIYDRVDYQCRAMNPSFVSAKGIRVVQACRKDCELLAGFAMRQLTARYGFFVKRDVAYYELLIKEMDSLGGSVRLVYVNGEFAGYYLYSEEEKGYIQEVLFDIKYETELTGDGGLLTKKERTRPIIMGKYLRSGSKTDPLLKALAQGKCKRGFINEAV